MLESQYWSLRDTTCHWSPSRHWPPLSVYDLTTSSLSIKQSIHRIHIFPIWRECLDISGGFQHAIDKLDRNINFAFLVGVLGKASAKISLSGYCLEFSSKVLLESPDIHYSNILLKTQWTDVNILVFFLGCWGLSYKAELWSRARTIKKKSFQKSWELGPARNSKFQAGFLENS